MAAVSIFRIFAIVGVCFACASGAWAAPIVDTDRDSFVDTSTGLEWMDLGVNNGLSYNEVLEQTQSGGLFEGWRIAETHEVYALWENVFTSEFYTQTTINEPNHFEQVVYDPLTQGIDSSFEFIFDVIGFNEYLPATDTYASLVKFQGYNGLAFIEFVDRPYEDGYFRDYINFNDAPYWSSDYYYNERAERYSTFLVRVTAAPEPVTIDIKPGSEPNCFNVNGHGVIPVAVLSSESFDAARIDVTTLSFGGLDVRIRGNRGPLCSLEDINLDGLNDLVCQFQDNPEYWDVGEDEATLTGALLDGTEIEGTDSICIVP